MKKNTIISKIYFCFFRVTISRETPVNIEDVLERRPAVNDTSLDDYHHLDHHGSTLLTTANNSLNSHVSAPRHGISSIPPSPRTQKIKSSPALSSSRRYPPEIRLNDGEGSIESMRFDNQSSPKFISQSESSLNRLSYLNQSHSRIHDGDDFSLTSQDSRVDEDDMEIFDTHSEIGDNLDMYVGPLNRVLDDEEFDLVSHAVVVSCVHCS